MVNDSRIGIYDYIYGLLYGVVTENVYSMNEPQELTESDTRDGFIVIIVGDLYDLSEFEGHTYGYARVYVNAYVPPMTRGRLDFEKYQEYETAINDVIKNATDTPNTDYYIQQGSVLSMDGVSDSNANNSYYMFTKSFIVVIDKQE